MRDFELSENIIDLILDELKRAEKFIKIAVFQLHNEEIFNIINDKLKKGLEIEIFTLPYDSIHQNIEKIQKLFEGIIKNGAKVYFCKWNVGDPERTTTAVGVWYSFHGKFLVTDKIAIAFSANLTENSELDVLISFKNEKDKIDEFSRKFDYLRELFIDPTGSYSGKIRQIVTSKEVENVDELFELPPSIKNEGLTDFWIQHYPSEICPEEIDIEEKLYIAPFDCKARNFITKLLNEAKSFAYICIETFTDSDIPDELKKISLKGIDIRIISGSESMDFQDRINENFKELIASDVKMKTIIGYVHGKMIITDKHLMVSSINFNKMNLGFDKTKKFWRANTETLLVCSDEKLIEKAKQDYIACYDKGIKIERKLAEKIEKKVGNIFTTIFQLKTRKEVKELFSRLIIAKDIEEKKFILTIGKITAKIMKHFGKNMVQKEDFLLSLILFYLSERKHDIDQLKEKLEILETDFNLNKLLNILIKNDFIEKEGDHFKLNVGKLF